MTRWLLWLWCLVVPATAWAQSQQLIYQAETTLPRIGYTVGPVDGVADKQTKAAILSFQYDFGFEATGVLLPAEAQFLNTALQIGAMTAQIIVEEPRTEDSEPEWVFENGRAVFPSLVYANGAHYLASRGYRQHNSENYDVSSKQNDRSLKLHRQRLEAARQLAEQTGDAYGLALIDMDRNLKDDEYLSVTLPALELIVGMAVRNRGNAAFFHTALEMAEGYKLTCDKPESRERVYRMVSDLLDLFEGQSTQWPIHGFVLKKAIECAPDDRKPGLRLKRISLPLGRDPEFRAVMFRDIARGAMEDDEAESARIAYRVMHDIIRQSIPSGYGDKLFLGPVADLGDFQKMHSLGMTEEVREATDILMRDVEEIPVEHIFSATIMADSRRMGVLHLAEVLAATQQTDGLRRLNAYLKEDPSAGPWPQLLQGLEALLIASRYEDVVTSVDHYLPQVLQTGDKQQVSALLLDGASAAIELGAFDRAERYLNAERALEGSRKSSQHTQAQNLRAELNLSRSEQVDYGALVVGQVSTFLDAVCSPGVDAESVKDVYAPGLDHARIGASPETIRAIAASDLFERITTCRSDKLRYARLERLVCMSAAARGRIGDLDQQISFILRPNEHGLTDTSGVLSCAAGMADAGRTDLLRRYDQVFLSHEALEILYFAGRTRAQLLQLAHRLLSGRSFDDMYGDAEDMLYLLKPRAPTEQEELKRRFSNSYVTFNSGASASQYEWAAIRENSYQSGVDYLRLGLPELAEALFLVGDIHPERFGEEADNLLLEALFDPRVLRLRIGWAQAALAKGDAETADRAVGDLTRVALKRMRSADQPLPGSIEQWAARLRELFEVYVTLQFEYPAGGPDYPGLFEAQQYLNMVGSSANQSVLQQRLDSASPELVRDYQDTRRALRRALNAPASDRRGQRIAELNSRLNQLSAELPGDDAASRSHQLGIVRDLTGTIGALQPGEALLVATQLPDALILTYADDSTARARRLPWTREQTMETVARFRDGILESDADHDRFSYVGAARLYEELIGWARLQGGMPGTLKLYLHGPLAALPVGALRQGDKWLGAETALQVSTSVARALAGPVTSAGGEDSKPFLGIGDPELKQGNRLARQKLLGEGFVLPELPETKSELSFLALVYRGNPKTDVLTGGQASERILKQLDRSGTLARTRVLGFATHGLLSRQTGALNAPGLVLSLPGNEGGEDGILTAPEIYSMRIGADLVILSACNTGNLDGGGGISELASAFFYAGAQSLLLTHWEIDSGAGLEITTSLARARARGEVRTPHALRAAIAGMLQAEKTAKYRHPRFWASHFVVQ